MNQNGSRIELAVFDNENELPPVAKSAILYEVDLLMTTALFTFRRAPDHGDGWCI